MHIHHLRNRTGLNLAAVFAVIVVAGCGGGGGGGGGGSAGTPGAGNPGFSYPTSLMAAATADIGGFSAAYSLNSNTLTSIAPGAGGTVVINLNTPSTGAYTVNVSAIPHPPPATPEPSFSFVVAPTSLLAGANVPGTACAGCFRAGSLPASDGQTVAFVDLDLAAAHMTYSTLGLWIKPSRDAPLVREVGGGFSFGVLTRGVDLPTTGSATYNGWMIGRYADGAQTFTVGATAAATANFGTTPVGTVGGRSVAFSTSGTTTTNSVGATALATTLNLSGAFTYTPGSNQLNATFTSGNGMTGPASASFYGPPATTAPFAPPEFGGAYAVQNAGNQSMVGAFGLKR